MRSVTRIATDQRGTTIIEASFILPVFILLMLVMLELGLILFWNNLLENISSEVALQGAVGCAGQNEMMGACNANAAFNREAIEAIITSNSGGTLNPSRMCIEVMPYNAVLTNSMLGNNILNLGAPRDVMVYRFSYEFPLAVSGLISDAVNLDTYESVYVVRNEDFGPLINRTITWWPCTQ